MTSDQRPQSSNQTPLIPKGRIGRFIYESQIGKGSVGIVCLFRDPMIGRKIAIKVLNPQLATSQRQLFEKHFIQEARAAGRLNHPNIVTVYDADKCGELLYIAMEYLEGQELSHHISNNYPFTYKHIAEIIGKIASALDYAHDNGVIHRDIKPANIFITEKGTPKVLDFGIASASRQLTDTEATLGLDAAPVKRLMGTPNYMSPEQARADKVDGRTDIFSLGVVLYQLLCGKLPFQGNDVEELLQAVIKSPAIPPHEIKTDVPLRLAKIAAKALAKKPADRYQRASEMAKDLNRYLEKERTQRIIAKIQNPDDKNLQAFDPNDTHNLGRNSFLLKLKQSPVKFLSISVILLIALIFGGYQFQQSSNKANQLTTQNLAVLPLPEPIKSEEITPTTSTLPIEAVSNLKEPIPDTDAQIKATAETEKLAEKNRINAAKKLKAAKLLEANKPEAAQVVFGSVNIAISPWGEVFVDGQSKGVTPPLTKLKLPVGKHRIEIKNGENSHVVNLEVGADKDAKINHRF